MDDFSPIYQGDIGVPFAPQFLHKDNTPVNLSGATISMKMQQVASIGAIGETTGAVNVCSGPWSIDDATNGKTHYQYQSSDVGTPGTWNLLITISIGGLPVHSDTKQLIILPAP